MGNVLDTTIKKVIFEGPLTLNSIFTSDVIDIEGHESNYVIFARYDGGASVNITYKLEGSMNMSNWMDITGTTKTTTDNEGTITYDMPPTGLSFVRLKIEFTSGSLDLQEILYFAKRRH